MRYGVEVPRLRLRALEEENNQPVDLVVMAPNLDCIV